jgi:hypothetical protein
MVFVSRLGFAAQRASAGQHCRLTEQDSAHVATAADLTALGDCGVRVARVRCWVGRQAVTAVLDCAWQRDGASYDTGVQLAAAVRHTRTLSTGCSR